MKKFIPYFLITLVFGIFLFFKHPQIFRYKFDQNLVHNYLRSQDIEDPEGKIKDRVFVSDSDIYQAVGYLYVKGEDPTIHNFQHPPLIKYLFGFSTLMVGNPYYVQIIFGLALLFLTYFAGTKVFKSSIVGYLGVMGILMDPVFGGMMSETLLDLGQTVFALSFVILTLFYPANFVLQGIILGLFAASKFWSTAVIFTILLYAYKILIRKEKIHFGKTVLSFAIAFLVFCLTYLVSFIKAGGLFNILAYQGRVLRFMLSHNSAVAFGGPLVLFLTGSFKSWWGGGVMKSDLWSIFWPIGIVTSVILAIKTEIKDFRFFLCLFPLVYLLLSSTQVPFARYFISILPYLYLNLGSIFLNFSGFNSQK